MHVDTVRTWRGRFAADGMKGLADRPGSGRPPVFAATVRAEIKALACALRAEHGLPLSLVVCGPGPRGRPPAGGVGTVPAPHQHQAVLVDCFDRHGLLVWVHAHDHSAHVFAFPLEPEPVGEDGESYFEAGSPLWSHASPRCPAGPHAR